MHSRQDAASSWDGFRHFLAVARTGRVSRAAKHLGVEHTTVSRRLDALEAELGVPLFHRTAGGYRLTAHGERALADAEAMERAALAIGARAREKAGHVSGRVRLALLDELASHWVAPELALLRERHPALEVQLLVGIAPLDLSRGEADLAVRTPRPRQQGLAAVRLAKASTGLYAARSLLGGRRLRVDGPASARGMSLLVYAAAYDRLQSAEWFRAVLAETPVAMTTNSTHALLSAALAGAGLAVLPRFVARRHAELVSVSEDLVQDEMWLAVHPEVRRDPKVRALADFLKERAPSAFG